eukprot:TRINITY_DN44982_c0_g1_i1.p1 TRINITY_DN44982_c0_g1~~TRINITY_DN44982_c0_g1_i1.p1  ORF type:complete len:264 (-),score=30.00 TRINITY_DN44982_c0_g1_i1:91-882(-)
MGWLGELFFDTLVITGDICIFGTFASVLFKLLRDKTSAGLSLQTILLVVVARTMHIWSHFLSMHYSPRQLPWLIYPALDVTNGTLGILVLVVFSTFFFSTYEKEKDNFGMLLFNRFKLVPKTASDGSVVVFQSAFMFTVVGVSAFVWKCFRQASSTPGGFFSCFYELLLAVALLPQLWMFNQDKRVSPLLANFVVLTALNRFSLLTIWVSFPWVYPHQSPDNRTRQIVSEALNLLILSDFLYYWVRSKLRGDAEIILGGVDEV